VREGFGEGAIKNKVAARWVFADSRFTIYDSPASGIRFAQNTEGFVNGLTITKP
jgi:hypothetical protein